MLTDQLVFASRSASDPVREALNVNRPLLRAAFLFSAVNAVLALTVSFYMLQVYDRVLTSRSEETLLLLTLIAAAALIVFGALDALRMRLLMRTGLLVCDALGARVLRAMVPTLLATGDPAIRQGLRDCDAIKQFLASPGFASLIEAPFLAIFLAFLLFLHWAYFLIVLAGGIILVGLAFASESATRPILTRAISTAIDTDGFVEGGLRNADVLEGLGMSENFVRRWRRQWLESQRLGLVAFDREAGWTSASRTLRLLIQVALLSTGALLVLDFQATGGIMIAASILGARALAPVEAMVAMRKNLIAVRLAHHRLVRLLELVPARAEPTPLPPPLGRLRVENLAYAPPGSRRHLFAGLNFELAPGESLCITGPSASGKSTLARLLTGAWPCTNGVVRLDGADIHAWPREALGHYVGYLPQDVELFAGTVAHNIARLTDGEPEAVIAAARLAHAHDMILGLPQGYDTEIGESGYKLSGGQRQRIGLARALYGDPRLVVLDEPNSNLDAAGEEALHATLVELKARGVTLVLIAHSRRMLAGMDKVLVLRDGGMTLLVPRNDVLPLRNDVPSRSVQEAAP
jgi:PrtD family type I secretion system ABC transporter